MGVPELLPYEGSWIVSRRDTGEVVGEFFSRQQVEMFNPTRVVIEGAGRYLARLNSEIKAAQ